MPESEEQDPLSIAAVEEQAAIRDATGTAAIEPGDFGAVGDTVSVRARGRSPSEIIWLKLRRNRTAMVGLCTLAALYAAAIIAGFLAPYKYDTARHDLPFYR